MQAGFRTIRIALRSFIRNAVKVKASELEPEVGFQPLSSEDAIHSVSQTGKGDGDLPFGGIFGGRVNAIKHVAVTTSSIIASIDLAVSVRVDHLIISLFTGTVLEPVGSCSQPVNVIIGGVVVILAYRIVMPENSQHLFIASAQAVHC